MGATPPAYPPPSSGRKLDTAGTFERIFALYRSQFAVLLGAALAIYVPIGLLSGIVATSRSILLVLVVAVISLFGQALYTGVVVEAVADMRDGRRDFAVGDLLRAAMPYVVPLTVGAIVYALCVGIGFVLIVIPGLIFLTWFSLFAPAIVVERRGALASLSRSRALVRGNGWRVFGVIVVAFILQAVIQNVLQRVGLDAHSVALRVVLAIAAGALTAPIMALAASVLYFQLRDIEQGARGPAAPAPPPGA